LVILEGCFWEGGCIWEAPASLVGPHVGAVCAQDARPFLKLDFHGEVMGASIASSSGPLLH